MISVLEKLDLLKSKRASLCIMEQHKSDFRVGRSNVGIYDIRRIIV